MDEAELADIDGTLRTYLGEAGLGWIPDQVDETIREERRVPVEEEPSVDYLTRGTIDAQAFRRKRPVVYTTRPYTQQERVLLLIQAMRRAIVQAAEAEVAVTDFLAHPFGVGEDMELVLTDETGAIPQRTLTPEFARAKRDAAADLEPILNELAHRVESE
jgi:hypothetical protein